ncbi:MAG: rhomboid family intramembrane serine protease [Candidatus Aenigmatarchaeota archaeon]
MFFKSRKGQFFPLSDTAPRRKFPLVTITLITLNVFVFILSLQDFEFFILSFGFIPAHPSLLTLFTSMFLHGGFDHIFGNMWYLWIFGDNIEDRFGRLKFLILYFFSGIVASFFHLLTNIGSEIPAIGASGAVSGILGSYFLIFPKEMILTRFGYSFIHIPAYIVIGFWFVLQFVFATISFFGFSGSNVAFWAHVGGFVFGIVFTLGLKPKKLKFYREILKSI